MVALMGCCRCEGKGRSNRWRGRNVVERVAVKLMMRVLVAAVGCWDDREREREIDRERERERERERKKDGERRW
jgi:hypothetical protein